MVVIREWFLLHLSGKFVSSFYDPLNKIILGKCPVVGRGQFLDRQLHPLSLMQKGNDISIPIKKIEDRSFKWIKGSYICQGLRTDIFICCFGRKKMHCITWKLSTFLKTFILSVCYKWCWKRHYFFYQIQVVMLKCVFSVKTCKTVGEIIIQHKILFCGKWLQKVSKEVFIVWTDNNNTRLWHKIFMSTCRDLARILRPLVTFAEHFFFFFF